ncbi:MAG: glycosyltransferase [Terriglobales bacterium]
MKPVRILQVVGSMHRGGIETWLMSVLGRIDPEKFAIDFLVSNATPSPFRQEIEQKGSKLIVCLAHSEPLRYMRNLRRALKTHGPYDIIHSHLHHLNGLVAFVGAHAGVPVRAAHSHFAIENGIHGIRYRTARLLMNRYTTDMLACSAIAGAALYGEPWEMRGKVILCGIDLSRFREAAVRQEVRAELGLPSNAIVVGHAGRFVPQKNHTFLLDIAEVLIKRDPRFHFALLGDGPLRSDLMTRIDKAGMKGRIHFLGARPDVPRIMLGAMDGYLFPSHFEGAPLALVEAQAAGLPCLYSDVCATETDLVPGLLRRMPLQAGAEAWANSLEDLIQTCPAEVRYSALQRVESTPFNLTKSIDDLEDFYSDALARNRHSVALAS